MCIKKETRYASQREKMLNAARRCQACLLYSLDAQFGLLDAYLQRVELNVRTNTVVELPVPHIILRSEYIYRAFCVDMSRQCSGREISKLKARASGENLQHQAESNLFVYCTSNLLVNLGRRKQRRYSHTQYMRYLFSMILFRFYDLKILWDAQSSHICNVYLCCTSTSQYTSQYCDDACSADATGT